MLIIFTSTESLSEAETLAKTIVTKKLAACVQVLPQMKSFYHWENAVQVDSEYLLLIKTLESNYQKLEQFIKQHHSYSIPEIIAVKAEEISDGYLGWMTDYLK